MARQLTKRLEALEATLRVETGYTEAMRAVECMNEASGQLNDPDFLEWAASELRDGPPRYDGRIDPCEEPERWALNVVLMLLEVAEENGVLDNPPAPPDIDALADAPPPESPEDIPRDVGLFLFWLPALWVADALGPDDLRRVLAEVKRRRYDGVRIKRGEL